jgi:hypothetical protein
MTIKQQGGIFGRNPSFNEVTANDVTIDTLSSPAVDLQSNGVADFKKYISITDTNVRINMLETDTIDENTQIRNQSGNFEIRTLDDDLASGTTRLQIDHTNGDTTISTGNLIIGTSGKGIDFSATSGTGTSELFDDYEEGNFSPNVDGSVTGTATYTRQVGKYIKVGAQVTAIIDVRWSAHTGSGTMYIKDLPFVGVYNAANITQSAAVGFYGFSIGAGYIPSLTLGNSSSTLLVGRQPVGGGASAPNSLPSSGTVVATITYMAA